MTRGQRLRGEDDRAEVDHLADDVEVDEKDYAEQVREGQVLDPYGVQDQIEGSDDTPAEGQSVNIEDIRDDSPTDK